MKKIFTRASMLLIGFISTAHADKKVSALKTYVPVCAEITNNFTRGFFEGLIATSIIDAAKSHIFPLLPFRNPLNISTETISDMSTPFLATVIGAHCTTAYTDKKSCREGVVRFLGIIAGACIAHAIKDTLTPEVNTPKPCIPVAEKPKPSA